MNCSCPKCKADITEELSFIPDEGVFLRCPSCNTNFNVRKESFATRAQHTGDDISCAECGSRLGPAIYCRECHALYPDFYVAETSSAAKKQMEKFFSRLAAINRLGKTGDKKQHHHAEYDAPAATAKKNGKGLRLPSNPVKFTASLAILLIILGCGGFYYYTQKIENDYMSKYVNALFVIKTSEDYNKKICEKTLADWQAKQLPAAPALVSSEQTFLSRGVKETELVMKDIPKPPEKFKASGDALVQLYEIYKKHQKLAAAPSGTPESFIAESRKLDDSFRKGATALKTTIPEKLTDKLNESKVKFKELQGF